MTQIQLATEQIENTLANTNSIISFIDVRKDFHLKNKKTPVTVLENLSFNIKDGTITGLVGPDGAGKTTLMRLAAGLYYPDNGKVHVLGFDISEKQSDITSKVGYMPQKFGLYEDLTIMENLNLYADLYNLSQKIRKERFDELLHLTDLMPFTNRLSGKLSGGMKQKLAIACILINRPKLIILDEPTVGVDPLSRLEIWKILKDLRDNQGITVFMSTAYLNEADNFDEIILLHRCKILAKDSPNNLKDQLKMRTFLWKANETDKITLKKYLNQIDFVIDTNLVSDGVRFLTIPGISILDLTIQESLKSNVLPVEPNFEDFFVDALISEIKKDKPINIKKTLKETTLVDIENINEHNVENTTNESIIIVNNLSRQFKNFYAVKDISFTLKKGEIFGLLGANGAGKSTTFRMLCGLLPPSNGEIKIAGFDMKKAPSIARQKIGYMSQKFSLYGNLSVMENLDFFSCAYGLKGDKKRQRILWALEYFDLKDLSHSKSIDLSLGYKQRLSLACALLHEPEIVFLDEPTSGVDPIVRREFWDQIYSLSEKGVTILVTTHFMDEAEYCNNIAIMASGKILCIGSPKQIKGLVEDEIPNPTLEDAFIKLIFSQNSYEQKTNWTN